MVINQIKVFRIYLEGNGEPLKGMEQGTGFTVDVRKIPSGFRKQSEIGTTYHLLEILFET